MKKIFIATILLVSIFSFRFVFSEDRASEIIDNKPVEDDGDVCKGQIDDIDGRCLRENEISRREAINMNNILKIVNSFDSTKNNTIPNFSYLSDTTKNKLIEKLSGYYDKNSHISTTTIESIPRSERDLFFRDAYVPYISLLKSISIFSSYNNLGSSIQGMITLLNSTELYIQNSDINVSQFTTQIQSARSQLQGYISSINSDIGALYTTIYSFDKDNPDSFSGFIDSSTGNRNTLNDRSATYFSVKDNIINLAVDAIRAVEIAYNGNSSIVASPNLIYSDGTSVSKVTITVKNTLKNPIVNRQVNLTSTSQGVSINPASGYTNASGVVEFSITSNVSGYINLKATIEGETLELLGSNIINVWSLEHKGCADTGGVWTGETCICQKDYEWVPKDLKCVSSAQLGCEKTGGIWEGKVCTCPKGYTWIEKDLKCINLAQLGCESTGGTWIGSIGGGMDEGGSAGTCTCPKGYTWIEKDLKCISLAQLGCESTGGTWKESICSCPSGYTWDEKNLKCITLAQSGCESTGGKWDGKICTCPGGYTWSASKLQCITLAQFGCESTGGKWDGKICTCPGGYTWSASKLQCITLAQFGCESTGGKWD
ncbi:MAG: Ig-like domain-containing protein, partial [Patescibacteria group bacterium]|nr:Ig-like domain-containing protein [Patescibacteria group bacterium]